MTTSTHDPSARDARHPVSITVNGRPVEVAGPRTNGADIKEAAITAGVQIEMSFQLLEEVSEHRTRIIGDEDPVEVHDGSAFLALAPDDNS